MKGFGTEEEGRVGGHRKQKGKKSGWGRMRKKEWFWHQKKGKNLGRGIASD